MNYFTQKYPYEERQGNLTARRRKRHMRKKPKRIKKGGGLSDLPGPFPSEQATRIRDVAADIRAAEIAEQRERLAYLPRRERIEQDFEERQRRNASRDRQRQEIMDSGITDRRLTENRDYLRAQRRAEAPARMGAPARAAARARDRLTQKRALDTELERINSRERALLKDIGQLNRRLTSVRDPAASHPRLPRERRRTKRKPGRRQQYEDILLQDMNREIQRPVRFDQLERRIPYKPVRHTPDPRGEKDYLRPFPYKLNIYDIKQEAGGGYPIPGEYLTTRLDIPSEAGPYLEVGFKVPKNYDPYKKAQQRFTEVEVTPLKGISYNYYNQAKFQTKKLAQKGYQKYKDRKESLKSFYADVFIDSQQPPDEIIEQEVFRPNEEKVLVYFKPPPKFPTRLEDSWAYDRERNEFPIPARLQGKVYQPLRIPIQLNLKVTPIGLGYRAKQGTKKVGKGLKKGAYYGALGTAYGIGVPLYGLGVGAVGTAKLARRGTGAAGLASGARGAIDRAGEALSSAYKSAKNKTRKLRRAEPIMNTYVEPDGTLQQHSEMGTTRQVISKKGKIPRVPRMGRVELRRTRIAPTSGQVVALSDQPVLIGDAPRDDDEIEEQPIRPLRLLPNWGRPLEKQPKFNQAVGNLYLNARDGTRRAGEALSSGYKSAKNKTRRLRTAKPIMNTVTVEPVGTDTGLSNSEILTRAASSLHPVAYDTVNRTLPPHFIEDVDYDDLQPASSEHAEIERGYSRAAGKRPLKSRIEFTRDPVRKGNFKASAVAPYPFVASADLGDSIPVGSLAGSSSEHAEIGARELDTQEPSRSFRSRFTRKAREVLYKTRKQPREEEPGVYEHKSGLFEKFLGKLPFFNQAEIELASLNGKKLADLINAKKARNIRTKDQVDKDIDYLLDDKGEPITTIKDCLFLTQYHPKPFVFRKGHGPIPIPIDVQRYPRAMGGWKGWAIVEQQYPLSVYLHYAMMLEENPEMSLTEAIRRFQNESFEECVKNNRFFTDKNKELADEANGIYTLQSSDDLSYYGYFIINWLSRGGKLTENEEKIIEQNTQAYNTKIEAIHKQQEKEYNHAIKARYNELLEELINATVKAKGSREAAQPAINNMKKSLHEKSVKEMEASKPKASKKEVEVQLQNFSKSQLEKLKKMNVEQLLLCTQVVQLIAFYMYEKSNKQNDFYKNHKSYFMDINSFTGDDGNSEDLTSIWAIEYEINRVNYGKEAADAYCIGLLPKAFMKRIRFKLSQHKESIRSLIGRFTIKRILKAIIEFIRNLIRKLRRTPPTNPFDDSVIPGAQSSDSSEGEQSEEEELQGVGEEIESILKDLNRRSVEIAGEAPAPSPSPSAPTPAVEAPAPSPSAPTPPVEAPAPEAPVAPPAAAPAVEAAGPSSAGTSSDDTTLKSPRLLKIPSKIDEEEQELEEESEEELESDDESPTRSLTAESSSAAGPSSAAGASSGQMLANKNVKDMTEKERLFRAWKVIEEIISKEEKDRLSIIEAKKHIDELYKKYSRLNRDSLLKLHGKEFMRKHYDQGFESLETKKKYWNICVSILKQIKVLLDKYNLEGTKLIEMLNKFLEQKSSVTTLDGYPEFPPEFVDLLVRYLRLSIQANVFITLLGAQEEGSKAFKIKETINIILDAEKEKFGGVSLYQLIYGLSKKVVNFEDHCKRLLEATGKDICILDTKEIKRNMLEHNMSFGATYDDLIESIGREDDFDIDKLLDLNSTDSTKPQPAKTSGLKLRLPTSKSSSSKQPLKSTTSKEKPLSDTRPMKAGPSFTSAERNRTGQQTTVNASDPQKRLASIKARQTFTLRSPSSSSVSQSPSPSPRSQMVSPSQSPTQLPTPLLGGKKKRKKVTKKKRKNKRKRRTNKKNLFFFFK
jgi:hypothetical protein